MNMSILLMGLVPLLVFVIVDSFAGVKAGVVWAIVFAIAEATLSFFWFGEVDAVTGFSIILVIGMGMATYSTNSPKFFKFQPVVLGVILSSVLLVSYWIGRPIIYVMLIKYQTKLPVEMQQAISNPILLEVLKLGTHYLGYTLLIHAMLVAYAAIKLSNWWWIIIRGVGFYVAMFIAIQLAALQIKMTL